MWSNRLPLFVPANLAGNGPLALLKRLPEPVLVGALIALKDRLGGLPSAFSRPFR